MEYIWMQRVGEVEEEHSFVDLTIDEWLVIRGAFLKEAKEDSHTTAPVKGFNISAALSAAYCPTNTIYGSFKE